MEIQLYVKMKNSNKYELREILTNENREFYSNLLKTVDQELENIKRDLLSFGSTNLIRPSSENSEINEKIEKLVTIRKTNLESKEKIKDVLAELEFIICKNCGGKMYKKPINIPFKKVGRNYIMNTENTLDIKYNFSCENCNLFIEEDLLYQTINLKKKREELIKDGYNFVPNEFGFWHFINDDKTKLPPELVDREPRYTYRRIFEKVNEGDEVHLHVYDVCSETGEKIKIF